MKHLLTAAMPRDEAVALLGSPHLAEAFPWIAAQFPEGLHLPIWATIPMAAALAGLFGVMLGAPTLKLRGDYLAIVTLGFAEVIRLIAANEIWLTNGTDGISAVVEDRILAMPMNMTEPATPQAVDGLERIVEEFQQ